MECSGPTWCTSNTFLSMCAQNWLAAPLDLTQQLFKNWTVRFSKRWAINVFLRNLGVHANGVCVYLFVREKREKVGVWTEFAFVSLLSATAWHDCLICPSWQAFGILARCMCEVFQRAPLIWAKPTSKMAMGIIRYYKALIHALFWFIMDTGFWL